MAGVALGSAGRHRLELLREIDWDRYLSDPSNDTSALSFLSGFGLGTIIGCLVAILLAPRSGREAREQVRYTGIELRARSSRRRFPFDDAAPNSLTDEAEQAEVDMLRRISTPE